jgi:hypothetical protein
MRATGAAHVRSPKLPVSASDRLTVGARRQDARCDMTSSFKIGDHVRWNSEAGFVTGKIIAIHTSDTNYKGYVHHANPDAPQYEIRSDKTDHVAMHKGSALKKID